MDKLHLKPNGILILQSWDGDIGEYEEIDVSDKSEYVLNKRLVIKDNATVRDLFTLINKNFEFYSVLLNNNWIHEYSELILNSPVIAPKHPENFIELYSIVEMDDKGMDLPSFPRVHGMFMCEEDNPPIYKKGSLCPYGIDFTPPEELADLPIKYKSTICFSEYIRNFKKFEDKSRYFPMSEDAYTLYQVIQAITWEMSFHGGLDGRNKIMSYIEEALADKDDWQQI